MIMNLLFGFQAAAHDQIIQYFFVGMNMDTMTMNLIMEIEIQNRWLRLYNIQLWMTITSHSILAGF